MHRRQYLEQKCKSLFGGVTDVAKRLAILKDAYWKTYNSGYCDHMAGILMSGRSDDEADLWLESCSLKREIAELCDIYSEELGE